MSEPYTTALITRLLRSMPDVQLAAAQPHDFQRWPASKIIKAPIIQEVINNERARRK